MSVAESIVMRAPIVQVGCRSACSGVTSASSAAERAAERPAARGHDQRLDRLGLLARQQLVQRRVLGVDRQQLRAAARERLAHERAAGDEALLVGERDVDAGLQRRQRRLEPGRADDGVEHDVRPALGSQLRDARLPSSTRPEKRARAAAAAAGSASAIVRTPRRSASRTTPSASLPRASAQTCRSGSSSQTWIACRPIEPVLPRRATLRISRRVGQARVTPCRAARRSRARPGRRRAARRCGRARRRGPPAACPSP